MKIAQIAPVWFPVPPSGYGGIELIVSILADGLVDLGHDVTLFAAKGSSTTGNLVTPLSEVPDPRDLGNVWFDTMHCLRTYLEILEGDYDIVHDHSGIIGPAIGVMAAKASRRFVLAHTLHGPWTPQGGAYYQSIDNLVELIAISHTQMSDNPHVRYSGMVYNGIDIGSYRFEGRKEEFLVYIGRANPDKGPVHAIKLAKATGHSLKMVLKRNEPNERDYFESEIAPILDDSIEVVQNISHDAKVDLLSRAKAMIFPIAWPEPFGLVMAEAMACGTPVIAGKWGAAQELVLPGETGYLCLDDSDYIEALKKVTTIDPARCRAWVEEKFSSEVMVAGYEALFARLLGR